MGVRKKPGTKNQAEPGRLTGRARPVGKTGGPVRRSPDQNGGGPGPDAYPPEGERLAGLEKKLKRVTRRLETFQTAGRHQRTFLSLQTHQIRAQLHAVMGYTELVLRKTRGQLPVPQAENLKKLLLSVEGLKAAIEGLAGFPYLDPKKSPALKIRNPKSETNSNDQISKFETFLF
jgi:signal transduction histidine kinase